MSIKKCISALLFSLVAAPVFSWTLYLQNDMGVRGNMRYCKYSDGKVYTFNSMDLCKLSIEGSAPGFGTGTGFLSGEYIDGMTKVCIYDVLGEKKAKRLNSTDLCPLNAKF